MVNEHGIIRRGIISIINCQSSPLEYCCYKDFCNGLTFIPLPVLTNLSCMVSTCQIDDEQCNHSIIYRSSPMESCTVSSTNCIDRVKKDFYFREFVMENV